MSIKERRLTTVPQTLFLVFGSIASIRNPTRTVDQMAQQTAPDTPLTRAITSVLLEHFLKVYKVAILHS